MLGELAEHGFRGLSMDGIANRAGTGRMSLYRRWNSPDEVALDAIAGKLAALGEPVSTGELRTDLLGHLRRMIEHTFVEPLGPAISAVIGEGDRYPGFLAAIREQVLAPHLAAIEESITAAIERGELSGRGNTEEVRTAGPAMIVVHNLINGAPPDEARLTAIVDNVVLPALRG